jgi:hypothetical protein
MLINRYIQKLIRYSSNALMTQKRPEIGLKQQISRLNDVTFDTLIFSQSIAVNILQSIEYQLLSGFVLIASFFSYKNRVSVSDC